MKYLLYVLVVKKQHASALLFQYDRVVKLLNRKLSSQT